MEITKDGPATYRNSAVRPGPIGLVLEAIREIRARHRLIRYLAQADLKKKGSDTFFGNVWWVLDPLLQMGVYVILVTIIFAKNVPAYPLFIFAAILPWKWFTTTLGDSISSVSGQDKLIKQIQFPKIVLPAAASLSGVVLFAFGFVPLFGMLILMYPGRISATLLLIPLVAAVQFVFTLAFSFALSALNVFFRDVGNLARHVLRLWFYLSPGLYGADTIVSIEKDHQIIGTAMRINPFFAILESYRNVVYYGTVPDWVGLGSVLVVSVVLVVLAVWFFKRLEPAFAKVL